MRALTVLLALLLVGCALDKPPQTEETVAEALPPETEVPETFQAVEVVDSGKVDDGWVAGFGDAELEKLVDELLANNLNLQAAAAQLDIVAAQADVARSALRPAIGLGGTASRLDAAEGALTGSLSTGAKLDIAWEADVWGRVRAGVEAAEAGLEASVADFEFARQSLVAQTAKTWFGAIQARQQEALAREGVGLFEEIVKIVEVKERVGKAAPQDLSLARADLASAQEALRKIQTASDQIVRGLEVLLGRYPSGELETADALGAVPPPVPAGLPSELLERRPDLIAAERRLVAAFYLSEQARAAKLPRIQLTGSVGTLDNALTDLINPGNPIWNVGAGLYAPLYQGGALQAGVEAAEAQQRAALAAYGQRALQAFAEVENALANEQALAEREALLERVVAENREAVRIMKVQYDVGRIELQNYLQVQARLLSARSNLIAIRNERLAQRVNLHLALGGSFEEMEEETGGTP